MKAWHYTKGSTFSIVHEPAIQAFADHESAAVREAVKQVLALEVGHAISFPSGAIYQRVADDTPEVHVLLCRGRAPKNCAFCTRPHTKLCDGPPPKGVKRKTCDKPLCHIHATPGGKDVDYCPDHKSRAAVAG
jgi:hypothetical protein